MPKQFYISTRKVPLAEASLLLDALKANGWKQTFAWSDQEPDNTTDYAAIAAAELAGVRERTHGREHPVMN